MSVGMPREFRVYLFIYLYFIVCRAPRMYSYVSIMEQEGKCIE